MESITEHGNILPNINLLCMLPEPKRAFLEAVDKIFPDLRHKTKVDIYESSLKYLLQEKELTFDAVVSPANSYARLDGAFDDALARVYGPSNDYAWITRMAQRVVYDKWKGFAIPGSCTIVPLTTGPEARPVDAQPWNTKFMLLCPTMRIPQNVDWDAEVVYECIWSLLNAVYNHNREARSDADRIKSILMTPLATGAGAWSNKRWAEQTVWALRHFVESVEHPDTWSKLEWDKASRDASVVRKTYTTDNALADM